MPQRDRSSRARYTTYLTDLQKRRKEGKDKPGSFTWSHSGQKDIKRSTKRTRSFWKLLSEFWNLMAGFRGTMIVTLATLSISTALGLIPTYGTKLVFDSVLKEHPLPPKVPHWLHLPGEPRPLLAVICVAMIVIAVISTLVGTYGRWQATRITKRVAVTARRKVFEHAVRLPLHRVYDLKSGGVASILREDAGGVGELVFNLIYNPWRAIVQLLGSLVILAFVDVRLLLGSLLVLPVVWMTHRTWIARIRPIFRDIRVTRTGVDSHATEAFGGMRVVRSFSRQRTESQTFTTGNHLMARQELLAWIWSRGIDMTWAILIPLASAVLLWYGGGRVLSDMARIQAGQLNPRAALTQGDLVMFTGYLLMLLGPIAALAQSATSLQQNLSGLDRTLDLLEEPEEMPDRPGAKVVNRDTVEGRITFRNVCFSYARTEKKDGAQSVHAKEAPNDKTTPALVLNKIDLEVLPGQTVALVGPSGAGKTTLCNLVARFYDPTGGSIWLDGADLRDIQLDSYRSLLGIVEQDTFLFDGSIADNIAYGRRDAPLEQIMQAAQLANAHEFISATEKGYDTLIGERGVKLSGGQRQRITIARAILADPRILILDEATSNLDSESERLIQNSLHVLMKGRTCFVIAHRLSTIAHADRIVVLEHGQILETGTHDELMSRSSRYRQMVELQSRPVQIREVEKKSPPLRSPSEIRI